MRCVVQKGNPEQARRPTRWGPLYTHQIKEHKLYKTYHIFRHVNQNFEFWYSFHEKGQFSGLSCFYDVLASYIEEGVGFSII